MARVSIEEALDDCLQRLPHEGLDACLRRYPQYADELRGLLQLGTMVSRTSVTTVLSNEARQRMRAQLFQPPAPTTANPKVTSPAVAQPTRALPLPATSLRPIAALFSRPLVRVALALIVLVVLFLGGGAASAHAAPGDALYPVKRFYEGMRYTFSLSNSDKANAQLDFASARLDEMVALVQRKTQIDGDLLTDLAANISYCSDQLNSTNFSAKQQLASSFATILQREQQVLGAVSSDVATNAQPQFTTARQSIAQYYRTVTQFAPNVPPLAIPTGLPGVNSNPTPSLPAAQDTATPMPVVATPSPTVILTDTATPNTTATALPSATASPDSTHVRHVAPTDTPLPTTPRPHITATPLPPRPTPTATHLPIPIQTPTPVKLKPTPPPKPTLPRPTVVVPPPTPIPTVVSGDTKGGKGHGNGSGNGNGNGQGGNGGGNGNRHGNGNGGNGGDGG